VTDHREKFKSSPAAMARYSRERARNAELTRETLELKHAGWSFRQIAERHGCSVVTSSRRYNKALAKYVPEQLVATERQASLDRWENILRSDLEMMAQAKARGDIDGYVKLHNAAMQIEDRRIIVLGMQAPKVLVLQEEKVEATPQETELQTLLAQAKEANEARRAAMGAPAPDETTEEKAA